MQNKQCLLNIKQQLKKNYYWLFVKMRGFNFEIGAVLFLFLSRPKYAGFRFCVRHFIHTGIQFYVNHL